MLLFVVNRRKQPSNCVASQQVITKANRWNKQQQEIDPRVPFGEPPANW